MSDQAHAAAIRHLNDTFRSAGPIVGSQNQWVMTPGVQALGTDALLQIIETVKSFSTFEAENDPYGEHDFGALDAAGERLFWKIDYYNATRTSGSDDPADSDVTSRVLTIMLSSEY